MDNFRAGLIQSIKRTFDLKTNKEVADFMGISERHFYRFKKEPGKYEKLQAETLEKIVSYQVTVITITVGYMGIRGNYIPVANQKHARKIMQDFKKGEESGTKINKVAYAKVFNRIGAKEIIKIGEAYQEVIEDHPDIEHDYNYFMSMLIREHIKNKGWVTRLRNKLDVDEFFFL